MRSTLMLTLVLALGASSVPAAAPAVHWAERPFFPRRPQQKVPPPRFYATTEELPAGTQLTLHVVRCPDKAEVDVEDFLGGPVFSRGVVKEFTDLAAGQTRTCKLDRKMRVGLTTRLGEEWGTCHGLEQKEGHASLTYSFGDRGDLVIDVKTAEAKP